MILSLCLPLPAHALEEAAFDISLRGIKGAQLAWRAQESAGGYAVSAAIRTTGAVGLLARFTFDGLAQGRGGAADPRPIRFEERVRTPEREGFTVLTYTGGTPTIAEREPPRDASPWDIDPAAQTGRIDPVTGTWLMLRDVAVDAACVLDMRVYDGRRATRVVLSDPQPSEGGVTCAGTYIRQDGFPPDEMAERTDFPFTLSYDAVGDRLQVRELRLSTPYGDAVLSRR